ncbi:MAG: adenosylcobinamide-GDP ribazoletransferase [Limimaricola sp.]|nr:adenosylcobinamide-GDP ribazoletransferase [Limimaricola sp.]
MPAALGLLSRLPVRVDIARAQARGAAAAWAWPLAGLVVGALAALAGRVTLVLGLPAAIAATVVLAASVILTGAMHEDGLADTADGLWGGWTPERRLEIMKDSRIGTYGVLALVLSALLRWQALNALIAAGALWAPVMAAALLARVPMAALMAALPNARAGGLSAQVGRPRAATAAAGALLALALSLGLIGLQTVPALLAMAVAAVLVGGVARARIGGQTGDILGAAEQLAETAVLLTLVALLP